MQHFQVYEQSKPAMRASFGHLERPEHVDHRPTVDQVRVEAQTVGITICTSVLKQTKCTSNAFWYERTVQGLVCSADQKKNFFTAKVLILFNYFCPISGLPLPGAQPLPYRHRCLDDHLRRRRPQLHRRPQHRRRLLRVHPDGHLRLHRRPVRGVSSRAGEENIY